MTANTPGFEFAISFLPKTSELRGTQSVRIGMSDPYCDELWFGKAFEAAQQAWDPKRASCDIVMNSCAILSTQVVGLRGGIRINGLSRLVSERRSWGVWRVVGGGGGSETGKIVQYSYMLQNSPSRMKSSRRMAAGMNHQMIWPPSLRDTSLSGSPTPGTSKFSLEFVIE